MYDDLTAELARTRADLELARDAWAQERRAVEAERAKRMTLESQLGSAYEEIARLTEALRQVSRMKTIKGARTIVDQAIGTE